LLLPVIILAAVGYRRGWLGMLLPLLLLPTPTPVLAAGWHHIWLTPDQQAAELLRNGKPAEAAQRFHNPEWRAAALHAAGAYQAAAAVWQTLPGSEARYNQGNALARLGHYREAIEAYEAALALKPDHTDAAANKALLERLLRQPPSPKDPAGSGTTRPSGATQTETTSSHQAPGEQGQNQDAAGASTDPQSQASSHDAADDGRNPNPQGGRTGPQGTATGARPDHQLPPPRYDEEIALEQWLRQIPDDPAGLLQRKFLLEHLQRKRSR
jgi:Ca-activated chloride channel family protein